MHKSDQNPVFCFTRSRCFYVLILFSYRPPLHKSAMDSVSNPPVRTIPFETIEVPGVDFLSLTASSDFEDYAGYTKSADGEKDVAFTLINAFL